MGFFYDDRPSKSTAPHAGIAPPYQCEACGTPIAIRHDFIDRSGDIEQLCADCYTLALEGNESPELARRDRIAAWVMAVVGGAALLLWLTGCDSMPRKNPAPSIVIINGEAWTEHVDADDPPAACGPVETWAGCRVTSLKRIDYRSPVANWTIEHERTEAAGMRHGPYSPDFSGHMCAVIVVGLGKYPTGGKLCIGPMGEYILESV